MGNKLLNEYNNKYFNNFMRIFVKKHFIKLERIKIIKSISPKFNLVE